MITILLCISASLTIGNIILFFLFEEKDNKMILKKGAYFLSVPLYFFSIFCWILWMQVYYEKNTAIECLKGNNPYEIKIIKTFENDLLIDIDTTYVLKK